MKLSSYVSAPLALYLWIEHPVLCRKLGRIGVGMDALERSDRTGQCRNVYTRLCSGCVGVPLVYHAVLAMSASIIYCCGAAHECKPQFNVTTSIYFIN